MSQPQCTPTRVARLSFLVHLLAVPGMSWVSGPPTAGSSLPALSSHTLSDSCNSQGSGSSSSSSSSYALTSLQRQRTHSTSYRALDEHVCSAVRPITRRQRRSALGMGTKGGRERVVDPDGNASSTEERPPRFKGRNMPRDETGLPIEKVYAPRPWHYGTPKQAKTGGGGGPKKLRQQGQARDPGIANPAKLRVLGGSVRGRRLESPDVYMRPMMGKVKEALFSTLIAFELFDDDSVRVLDCFSGSGSVGCEALSRGARHVTFVDFSKDCCEVSERNVLRCGFEKDQGKAVCADVLAVLREPVKFGLDVTRPYDLVTLTPPYTEIVYADLIKAVTDSPAVGENTLIVIEYPVELGCLPHVIGDGKLVGLRNRRYGRTVLAIYIVRPSGKFELADIRPEEFISLSK